jgi:uncharacterized Zn finger protein
MSYWGFRPYALVAERRRRAAKEIEKLRKKGHVVAPIVIEGRKIARSFWGKAWCDNLERYSDFANRLPRGRTYVGNGSVIDLRIARGNVEALVSGSEIYKVKIDIAVAASSRWKAICADCAGSVGSLIELLQGKLSKNVMERVCNEGEGLFPTPQEIGMSCSCPDWADMCKHVAATLYGVGARLDADPDLLFTLRGVDRAELVSTVGADLPLTRTAAASDRVLADDDVAALFGLEMDAPVAPIQKAERGGTKKARRGSGKTAAATRPAGDAKPDPAKKKRASGALQPSRSLAAKTRARQTGGSVATTNPPREPKSSAALRPKRAAAAPTPASVSLPPPNEPKAAKPRRFDPQRVGGARAAKWIGARRRKADR